MSRAIVRGAVGLLLCYVAAAGVVFDLRHPWATDVERLVWIRSALMFDRVPYEAMRPRS